MPVLDPTLDRGGYARVLAALLRVYRPLERKLIGEPIAGLGAWCDHKSQWLEQDLAALGRTRASIDALPDAEQVPTVASSAEALGCRYVLEGATLGGAIISRYVVDRLGLESGGADFFSAYRSDTAERWRHFVAVLERWGGEHPREHGAVLGASRATFLAIERVLRP